MSAYRAPRISRLPRAIAVWRNWRVPKGNWPRAQNVVAAAVDRTADNLEADGDDTVSGFGRSLAGLMRQLAGGLRERDIEQFAREPARWRDGILVCSWQVRSRSVLASHASSRPARRARRTITPAATGKTPTRRPPTKPSTTTPKRAWTSRDFLAILDGAGRSAPTAQSLANRRRRSTRRARRDFARATRRRAARD